MLQLYLVGIVMEEKEGEEDDYQFNKRSGNIYIYMKRDRRGVDRQRSIKQKLCLSLFF